MVQATGETCGPGFISSPQAPLDFIRSKFGSSPSAIMGLMTPQSAPSIPSSTRGECFSVLASRHAARTGIRHEATRASKSRWLAVVQTRCWFIDCFVCSWHWRLQKNAWWAGCWLIIITARPSRIDPTALRDGNGVIRSGRASASAEGKFVVREPSFRHSSSDTGPWRGSTGPLFSVNAMICAAIELPAGFRTLRRDPGGTSEP